MTDREPDEGRAGLRSPAWIISAVLIIAVLIVGGAAILWPRGDASPEEPTTPPTATQTAETTAPADPAASICGLEPGDQSVPTEPPAEAEWTLHGTFAAPSVEGVGPGQVDPDGLNRCFARSPTGALLAAINYWAMIAADPTVVGDARLLVDNAAAEQLRAQVESGQVSEFPGLQLAAYSIRGEPSDSLVVVDLVFAQVGSDSLLLVPMPMVWEAGDWQLELPATGDTGLRTIPSTHGYVVWSGTS